MKNLKSLTSYILKILRIIQYNSIHNLNLAVDIYYPIYKEDITENIWYSNKGSEAFEFSL